MGISRNTNQEFSKQQLEKSKMVEDNFSFSHICDYIKKPKISSVKFEGYLISDPEVKE